MGKIIDQPGADRRTRPGRAATACSPRRRSWTICRASSRRVSSSRRSTASTDRLYDQNCSISPPRPSPRAWATRRRPVLARRPQACGTVGRTADGDRRRPVSRCVRRGAARVESQICRTAALPRAPDPDGRWSHDRRPVAPGAGAALGALENAFYGVNGYVGTIHMNQRPTARSSTPDSLGPATPGC